MKHLMRIAEKFNEESPSKNSSEEIISPSKTEQNFE